MLILLQLPFVFSRRKRIQMCRVEHRFTVVLHYFFSIFFSYFSNGAICWTYSIDTLYMTCETSIRVGVEKLDWTTPHARTHSPIQLMVSKQRNRNVRRQRFCACQTETHSPATGQRGNGAAQLRIETNYIFCTGTATQPVSMYFSISINFENWIAWTTATMCSYGYSLISSRDDLWFASNLDRVYSFYAQ